MSKDKNVIQFPDSSERLLDKAGKLIDKEKFQEAFDVLETIKVTEENIIEVDFLKIICLTEFGIYEEAITKCEQILESVYVEEVAFIYINLLKIVGRHEEAEELQEEFDEMQEMDDYDFEEWNQVMDAMSEEAEVTLEEFKTALADKNGFVDQVIMTKILENKDITEFIPLIKNTLKAKKPGNMIKTMLLVLLAKHDVSNKVLVTKLGRQISITPNNIPEKVYEWSDTIVDEIEKFVEHLDPSLCHQSLETWNEMGAFIFPFVFEEYSTNIWAISIISFTSYLNGIEIAEYKELIHFLNENDEEVSEVLKILTEAVESSGVIE